MDPVPVAVNWPLRMTLAAMKSGPVSLIIWDTVDGLISDLLASRVFSVMGCVSMAVSA